jgi:alpha-tubulin suppressor-like RCC1 family protein
MTNLVGVVGQHGEKSIGDRIYFRKSSRFPGAAVHLSRPAAFALAAAASALSFTPSSGLIQIGYNGGWLQDLPAIAISGNGQNPLALMADSTVRTWGRVSCSVPDGLAGVKAISAGGGHSVALKSDGTVVVWGDNSSGQGNVPFGLSKVKQIAAGQAFTVALKEDGRVVVWGDSSEGQTKVPEDLAGVKSVAAGFQHVLALKEDGTLVGWGGNGSGQLAIPAGLSSIAQVGAGREHSVALLNDGTIVAWGSDRYGQTDVPSGLTDASAIFAGAYYNLALKKDGTVVAWGDTTYGNQIRPPEGLRDVVSLSTGGILDPGYANSYALLADGTVVSWGDGHLGIDVAVSGLTDVRQVGAGTGFTIALRSDGTLAGWGDRYEGVSQIPAGLDHVRSISVNSRHSIALKDDGTVVSWGQNLTHACDVPAGLGDVVQVAASYGQSLALKRDGTIVRWGRSDCNSSDTGSLPVSGAVAVAAGSCHWAALLADSTVVTGGYGFGYKDTIATKLRHVVSISARCNSTMALHSDGTITTWGGDLVDLSTPAGLDHVAAISCGELYMLALHDDGTVVAWGDNTARQIAMPMGFKAKAVFASTDQTWAIPFPTGVAKVGRNGSFESGADRGFQPGQVRIRALSGEILWEGRMERLSDAPRLHVSPGILLVEHTVSHRTFRVAGVR